MNRSIHIATICFKTSIASISLLVSASTFAHDGHHNSHTNPDSVGIEQTKVQKNVTKTKARKITRKFLSSRGFTKSIAPGGAHIRNVKSIGEFWIVEVALRDGSAADVKRERVFVNKVNGQLLEVMPESLRLALNEG